MKIDGDSGRALDEHLCFDELARAGTVLEARCHLPQLMNPLQAATAAALLLASAKLVERLGGKRRRGVGRCTLDIPGLSLDAALNLLEQQSPLVDPPTVAVTTEFVPDAAATGAWQAVPLTLTLNGPLAVFARTVGNVVESLDFLPGTYLLPHITRTLQRLGLDARSAIARGDVCVLPATLMVDGVRGRPVPMALSYYKLGGSFNNPQTLVNRMVEAEDTKKQLKPLREGYIGTTDGKIVPTLVNVPRSVRTHNTVEDGPQKPTTRVGGVYSNEAIAPVDEHGQLVRLCSELRVRAGLVQGLKADWWRALAGECRLGRSKKDDYGSVTVTPAAPAPVAAAPPPCRDNLLYVWLLSDTLLRDERLRPAPSVEALRLELEQRLNAGSNGVTLTARGKEGCLQALIRVRRVESWQTTWGLPRPSLLASQAGSCVVFQVAGTIEPECLQAIEADGIGERTAEGYGRLCFNDPLVAEVVKGWQASEVMECGEPKPVEPLPGNDPSSDYAQRIETAVWREQIRREALGIAAKPQRRQEVLGWNVAADKPPMSQLGGLRTVVHQLQRDTDRQRVTDWLDHLAQNPSRGGKWPGNALQLVRNLIVNDQQVWQEFKPLNWPTLTAGAAERLRRELWPLAVRTLIDACVRAHKRELEQRQQPAAAGAPGGG